MQKKLKVVGIRSATLINKLTTMVSPSLPIGLAYILGSIKKFDIDIKAIDAVGESPFMANARKFSEKNLSLGLSNVEIIKRLGNFRPDIFLLTSMFSPDWLILRDLIKKIKNNFPKSIIIAGGEHFSAMPEFCLENSQIDCIVYGEGEETIKEIISKILDGEYSKTPIEGAYIKKNNKILKGPPRNRVRCLKGMAWPAWEFFNVNIMLDNGIGNTSNQIAGVRPMPLNATRGCPYRCTFCSNPNMWGKLWRARPVEDVTAEMKYLNNKYGANHFDFTDLTLAVKKSWLTDFCNQMIKEKIPITWGLPSGTRSEVLDYEMLSLLRKAGLNDIDYAPESGSKKILEVMKKQISVPKVLNSLRSAVKAKMRIKVNIIIGYPEETRFNFFETWLFCVKCALIGVEDLLVMGLSIYPGSEVHNQIRKERNIIYQDSYFETLTDQGSLNYATSYSNHYTRLELNIFKYLIFSTFYLVSIISHPKRIIILIKDLIFRTGSTRLSMGLINLMRRSGVKV